jgi:hypothetical protein
MALLKRSVSRLSRKCPVGLPTWNSLPFLITNVVSGNESVGSGSYVTKRNSPLGLLLLHGGCEVTKCRVTRITHNLLVSNMMNTAHRQLQTLHHELWSNVLNLTTSDHLLLLSLPSALLPSPMHESAWFQTPHGDWALRTPPQAVCALQRTEESGGFDVSRVERDGKSVMVRCFYYYFGLGGLGASASNCENVATGRGVERLKSCVRCWIRMGMGWWTRRLHVAALPYPADYPTSSSFSFKDQGLTPPTPNTQNTQRIQKTRS